MSAISTTNSTQPKTISLSMPGVTAATPNSRTVAMAAAPVAMRQPTASNYNGADFEFARNFSSAQPASASGGMHSSEDPHRWVAGSNTHAHWFGRSKMETPTQQHKREQTADPCYSHYAEYGKCVGLKDHPDCHAQYETVSKCREANQSFSSSSVL